ncbi:MAG TPA: WD40 repeat domain-containing protein, partial [Fimbriimonadaceae bacterium]|nr:WD40 repeat domain-containing protein [Fimbriimonadaceae bacterium]
MNPQGTHIFAHSPTPAVYRVDGGFTKLFGVNTLGQIVTSEWSPDGSLIGVAERDRYSVVNASDGTLVKSEFAQIGPGIGQHDDPLRIRFTPDSSEMAFSQGVKIATAASAWECVELSELWTPQYAVAVSPDSKKIAHIEGQPLPAGELDVRVRLVDAESGELLSTHPLFHYGVDRRFGGFWKDRGVTGMVFTPDGTKIIATCADGIARCLDLVSGQVWSSSAGGAPYTKMAVSPGGTRVAFILSNQHRHIVCSVPDMTVLRTMTFEGGLDPSSAFLDEDRLVMTGRKITVYSLASGQILTESPPIALANDLAVTKDGKKIVGIGGEFFVYTLATGHLARYARSADKLALVANGRVAALFQGTVPPSVSFLNVDTGEEILKYDQELGAGTVVGVASPDDEYFVMTRADSLLLKAWNPFAYGPRVRSVVPNKSAKLSPVTLKLTGGGFEESGTIRLRKQGQADIVGFSMTVLDPFRAAARFDLTNAETGLYSVVFRLQDGTEAVLRNGFEVIDGTGVGNVTADFQGGLEEYRANRYYSVMLEYRNYGSGVVPAPFLSIESGMEMSLTGQGAYDTSGRLLIMGIGDNAHAGKLYPGEVYQVPVYFKTPATGGTRLRVRLVTGADSSFFADNWAQAYASSFPFPLPQYSAIWNNFVSMFGDNVTTMSNKLREIAANLASTGNRIMEVDDLMSHGLASASGDGSGIESVGDLVDLSEVTDAGLISFGRSMPTGLAKYRRGPFGQGWWHSFEVHLHRHGNELHIEYPGMRERHFYFVNEAWRAAPGDTGRLTFSSNGGYQIKERDGSLSEFGPDGHLMFLQDPNGNTIELMYTNGRLAGVSSGGRMMEVTWTAFPNNQHRITKLSNSAGQETNYQYDSSGDRLTRVILPGARHIRYDYFVGPGQSAGCLQRITFPDLSELNFTLDNLGRLAEVFG